MGGWECPQGNPGWPRFASRPTATLFQQPLINSHVLSRHSLRHEPPFKTIAAAPATELAHAPDGFHRLLYAIDNQPANAIVDHFRHRAAAKGDHRRPASHRLDHCQAEWLGPLDWKHERPRSRQQLLPLSPT